MWMLGLTYGTPKHGTEKDIWSVHDTEEEAREALAHVQKQRELYCWAIAPIKFGSEPHYTEA